MSVRPSSEAFPQNMQNFEANSPRQTLTHDICHGQIRRDFTSDEFFPGLYSHAKAHIAKRIGTIPWLLQASARELPRVELRPASGTGAGT
jgi:hypothetical protein